MKRASLIAANSIIVIANAFALIHGLRNRVGSPDAEITLTNRELRYFNPSPSDEDSGVTLHLQRTDSSHFYGIRQLENQPNWLDRQELQSLGFDCSVNPASPDAGRFYQRQRPRQAFVALEYDGRAWRAWLETFERAREGAQTQAIPSTNYSQSASHLVAIDADLIAGKLRARHPDRSSVVILPAVVAISLNPFPYNGAPLDPKRPVQIWGRIQELPSSIHVPRPFSDEFRRLYRNRSAVPNKEVLYSVHLRYGTALEPWVTGVEFTNSR